MTTAILSVGLDATQAYTSFGELRRYLSEQIPNLSIGIDEEMIRKRLQTALNAKPFGIQIRSTGMVAEVEYALEKALSGGRFKKGYGWEVTIDRRALAADVAQALDAAFAAPIDIKFNDDLGLRIRRKVESALDDHNVQVQTTLLEQQIREHVVLALQNHTVDINQGALTAAVRLAVEAGFSGAQAPAAALTGAVAAAAAARPSAKAAAKAVAPAFEAENATDAVAAPASAAKAPKQKELGGRRAAATRTVRADGFSVRVAEPISLQTAEEAINLVQGQEKEAAGRKAALAEAVKRQGAEALEERASLARANAAFDELEKQAAKQRNAEINRIYEEREALERSSVKNLSSLASAKAKEEKADVKSQSARQIKDREAEIDAKSLDNLRNVQFTDPRQAADGLKQLEKQLGKVQMAAALLARGEEGRAIRMYGTDAVNTVPSLDKLANRVNEVKAAVKGLKDLKVEARSDKASRRVEDSDARAEASRAASEEKARSKAFDALEKGRTGQRVAAVKAGYKEQEDQARRSAKNLATLADENKKLEIAAAKEIADQEAELDRQAEARRKRRDAEILANKNQAMGRVYDAAKFAGAQSYDARGSQVYGAKALVSVVGEDQARQFLGRKSFLVDEISKLETYRKKVREAKEDTSALQRVLSEAEFRARAGGDKGDIVKIAAAKDLRDTFGEEKTRAFLGKNQHLVEMIPQLDELRAKASSAGEELRRLGEIYGKAKFDAADKYNGRGVKIAGAAALVRSEGDAGARKFLGKDQFLVDMIPALGDYASKGDEGVRVTKAMRGAMNDAHSAARGLAGSMGQMWLTWGNTAPLVAAAALGGAMRAVYQNGKEVEYQLGFVSALTREAALSITEFNNALEGSMVAPTQAAEALRGLAQNGLNTREALASLPTVLNLATAGEMTLSEAALGATGVLAAFNLGISEMGRVADVFTRAAALSNTSVGSMVEAMKQASTVSDQYGVSLEETAATLAVMAKRNIEGSAAGTAMRNMLVELASPTKGAREAMDKLGMSFFDAQGNMKGYGEIIQEVKDKTQDLNEESRLQFLNKIFGERGGKAANALMSDVELYRETLNKLKEDSEGFTQSVTDALKATTEGRVKQLVAEFKSSTSSAFSESKNSVDTFVLSLNNAIASDKFKAFASSVTTNAAQTATALLNNLEAVTLLAGGFAALRVSTAAWAYGAVQIPLMMTKVTAGLTALTAGASFASMGMGALTIAFNALKVALGPVSIAISAAAALYLIFRDNTSETTKAQLAMSEALEGSNRSLRKNLEAMDAQIAYQTRYNDALREGKSIEEAKKAAGGDAESLKIQDKIREQETLVAKLRREDREKFEATYYEPGTTPSVAPESRETREAVRALNELNTQYGLLEERRRKAKQVVDGEAFGENTTKLRDFNKEVQGFMARNPLKAKAAIGLQFEDKDAELTSQQFKAELDRRTDQLNGLRRNVTLPADDKDAKTGEAARQANEKARAELELLRKQKEQRLAALREAKQAEADLLENQRRRELITQEDFEVERSRQSADALRLEQEILKDSMKSYQKVFDRNVVAGKGQNLLTRFQFGNISGTETQAPLDKEIRDAVVPGTGYNAEEIESLVVTLTNLNQTVGGFAVRVDNAQLQSMAELDKIAKGKSKDFMEVWEKLDDMGDRISIRAQKTTLGVGASALEKAKAEATAAGRAIEEEIERGTRNAEKLAKLYAAEAQAKDNKAQALFEEAAELRGVDAARADALLVQVIRLRGEADAARERAQALDVMLSNIKSDGVKAKENAETSKYDDVVKDFIKPEKDSYDGLEKQSASMLKLVDAYQKLVSLEKEYADAKEATRGKEEKLAVVEAAHFDKSVQGYAMMAASAKGMFKEQSSGYKMLSSAEKALRTYQMLMSMKAQAFELGLFVKGALQKMFLNKAVVAEKVAGDAVSAASATASAGTEVGAAMAKGQANALSSVTNQGGGDPYTAFPRIAAMAALMAGLGFAIRSSNKAPSFAPTNDGSGTVFGDKTAKSESINNSMESLKSVNLMTAKYSAQMAASLRNIENNIGGLATLMIRSGSINSATAGYQFGFKDDGLRYLEPLLKSGVFGKKTSLIGQGLEIGPQTLASARDGADARFYADIETKRKAFGVTYGTKRSTNYVDADRETEQQIGLVMTSFGDAIKAAADPLGKDLTAISSKVDGFVFNIGRIELSGLSAADQQARMMAVFSQQFDLLASSVLGGYEAFQKIGEGYGETIVRVATGVEQADLALRSLGISAADLANVANKQGDIAAELVRQSLLDFEGAATGIGRLLNAFEGSADELSQTYRSLVAVRTTLTTIGLNGEAVTSALLAGAGGLDNLTSSLSSFEENFLTDTEKLSLQSARLRREFGIMGLQMPLTADGFLTLVKGIDTSSEAGQELLGRVLQVSDSFYDMTEAIKNLGQGLEDEITRIRKLVAGGDVEQSPAGLAQLQAKFATVTAQARSGDGKALDELPNLSKSILDMAEKYATSLVDLRRLQLGTMASLQTTLDLVRGNATSVAGGIPAPSASQLTPTVIPAFASGGFHAGGLRLVGENGPELEVTGPSRIYNSAQTAAILSAGTRSEADGSREELVALREEIVKLRREQADQAAAIAANTGRVARVLERVSQSGDSLAIQVA